jgi:hypothetical protein
MWVKKPDSTIIKNSNGPLVDINEVTPDFSLFDKSRFNRPMGGRIFRTIPLETYRGCPYKCTFCNSPMQLKFARETGRGSFLRKAKMEKLRAKMRELVELYEPEFFYIVDDSFLARSEDEVVDFAEMYKEFKLPFWCNTRPENVTKKRLDMLQEVGCYRISFGVEHGNEEYRRKVLLRKPTNEELFEKFEIIAQSGIAFSVNNITGFPYETRELAYHGTPLRDLAVAKGYLDKGTLTTHTTSSSLLRMPSLSWQEIDGLARTFTLYAELPKSMWPKIEVAERFDEEGERMFGILSELYQQYLGEDQFSRRRQMDWEEVFGHMSKTQLR